MPVILDRYVALIIYSTNYDYLIKLIYKIIYSNILKMLIPVKCFTCGKVLADKYRYFEQEVRRIKGVSNDVNVVTYLTQDMNDKTPEGTTMDKLKLDKICCRRHMLTHVEIE